ncbi:zinc finger protein 627 [Drosophila willistoni]|uniref:zinc finger protein 627 n=1 Tax=Drosophila willistoni TaxID=7260 RepID=UPI000C26D093|nr:zinc finger protein 627 [Drosophila willistoni]
MRHRTTLTTEKSSSYAISVVDIEQEIMSSPLQHGQDDENYAVSLEDVRLFAQLDDLNGDCDDLELLTPCNNFDLIDLVNGALQQTPTNIETLKSTEIKVKSKRTSSSSTTKAQTHICPICGRGFSEAYNLRIHKMTHTNEKPHICDACGKGFRQLNKLRIHYVTHTTDRPHKCDICDKGFRYANYLTVHRRLHTGEKPYRCQNENCQMFFHSIHKRRVHMKTEHSSQNQEQEQEQTKERDQDQKTIDSNLSYTCPICQRVLSDQCYLNVHLKRHYNQRDFQCPQPECSKRFFSSSELKHHQISHTQLRPFGCTKCQARFLRKSNYKQHMKIHERRH